MSEKREIAIAECGTYGVKFPCEEIVGQQRFRVSHETGCVAGIIVANDGGWQNSHTSRYPDEVAVIHRGWAAIATPCGNGINVRILRSGDSIVMKPDFRHNTYMSAGSMMLYLKYGDCREGDWIADPELDLLTKPLSESQILEIAEKST